MKPEVILFFPGANWIGTNSMYPPLPYVPVAAKLEEAGYRADIVDTRIEDFKKVDLKNAVFAGISSMTGRQIGQGLEIARHVRETEPELPIVWGGVHPSLLPEQTLRSDSVDIVVRGEGEITAVELTKALENGDSLEGIEGVSYMDDKGKVIHNPNRPFMNLDETPDMRYDLLKNVEAYAPHDVIHYTGSRGCPQRCAFCYSSAYCDRTWRTKSTEKILEELAWVMDEFNPSTINFLEDNFFVSKKRVEEICRGIIREKMDFNWAADCRSNYFRKYDSEFMNLLKKSGCSELIIGAESGSDRILKYIQKDITVTDTIDATKKCADADISVFGLFMIGFPTETIDEVHQTMALMDRMEEINKKTHSVISVFGPFPGTKLFDIAVENGFTPPSSLEEWGRWMFSSRDNVQWFPEKYREMLEEIAIVSRVKSAKFRFTTSPVQLLKQSARLPFVTIGKFRWNHRFFDYPYDGRVWNIVQNYRGYF